MLGIVVGTAIGCSGRIGAPTDADPSTPPSSQAPPPSVPPSTPGPPPPVAPPAAIVEIEPQLRRLTSVQFENTVVAAFGDRFAPEDFPVFGDDLPTIGLANDADLLRVDAVNVESLYRAVEALAATVVSGTPELVACVAAETDDCFDDVIADFGRRLWRRPLDDSERADLSAARARVADASGTRAEQAELVVQALLLSPHMLFRTELGVPGRDVRSLTAYEIASALSYGLWNAPPDAELLAAAADGSLSEESVLVGQARRMAQDPRLGAAVTEFFVDYLKLAALADKEKDASLGLTPAVRAALEASARLDLQDILSMPQAKLTDPFGHQAFRMNELVAPFFGATTSSTELTPVAVSPSERRGILSHPAFLSVHSGVGNSGIVKRGVFTLEQLLCVHLGAPPDDVQGVEALPEGFDPETASSRERLDVQHSSQPACVGCHQFIDPAGYGFENYDGAGRYRTVERGTIPIDASGALDVRGEQLRYADSVEFISSVVESQAFDRCLSDAFLAYMLGNEPSRAERDAFYARYRAVDGDVARLAELIVTTPSFAARALEAE